MRYIIIILLLTVYSCDNKSNEASYSYQFFEASSLTVNTREDSYMKYGVIEQGNSIVFKYTFHAEDEEDIADDEYSEYIYFEIDPKLTEFEIGAESLIETKTTLTKGCFCFFGNASEKDVPPIGTIRGNRLSDTKWNIELNVLFYGEDERIINEIFALDN